jgi:hypothetical protein
MKSRKSGWVLAVCWLAASAGAQSPLAGDPLGWRLGSAAWSFNRFTFFEAVDKTAALGLRYIEAFEGERINAEASSWPRLT